LSLQSSEHVYGISDCHIRDVYADGKFSLSHSWQSNFHHKNFLQIFTILQRKLVTVVHFQNSQAPLKLLVLKMKI